MHAEHPIQDWLAAADRSAVLVDVREPHEFAEATLPGAVNIPLDALRCRFGELDRQRPVAVFCRSGVRSTFAAEQLCALGFADVTNLTGGMLALADQPTH